MQYVMKIWLGGMNLTALVLYGLDKYKAVHHKWRIPEDVLIGMAAAGGGIGAFIGMHIFHHKTRQRKFQVLVPLFILLWAAGMICMYKISA